MIWFTVLILLLGAVNASPFLHKHHSCENNQTTVRKEWGQLSVAQRINYTDAVKCLARKPPRLPTKDYPGVRSRFDDFVAGLFLPWHRRFLHLWETALRDECGYTGYQPYWNWPLWADDLKKSPLFDCSVSSLSGDGEYNPGEQSLAGGNVTIPRGSGGGCVPKGCGPFADFEVHLGPFSRNIVSLTELPEPKFDYNPRCLNRSLNHFVATHYTNNTLIDNLMSATNITQFQTAMDHWPARPDGVFGVHGGGHFSLGAAMQDLFASPQDPAFMLHHSMLDRLWTNWQAKDEKNRRYAINGTTTILNPPWGQKVTLDTVMEFGVLDRPRRIREVMSPTAGGLCYSYT